MGRFVPKSMIVLKKSATLSPARVPFLRSKVYDILPRRHPQASKQQGVGSPESTAVTGRWPQLPKLVVEDYDQKPKESAKPSANRNDGDHKLCQAKEPVEIVKPDSPSPAHRSTAMKQLPAPSPALHPASTNATATTILAEETHGEASGWCGPQFCEATYEAGRSYRMRSFLMRPMGATRILMLEMVEIPPTTCAFLPTTTPVNAKSEHGTLSHLQRGDAPESTGRHFVSVEDDYDLTDSRRKGVGIEDEHKYAVQDRGREPISAGSDKQADGRQYKNLAGELKDCDV
ncbi:hypothetical protein AC579_1110 [Pseudocercospora musae]|uniref:Uncharacterized protein n=1 Tax=Pseudocercospora musae TaxID=113226 RepID=A0A139HZS1_9PEZI|nr:hypothetical protein AC579_1110 [Pseudocercospora musae]